MKNLMYLLLPAMVAAVSFTSAYNWRDDIVSQITIRRTCKKTHLYSFCVAAVNDFPVPYKYTAPFNVAQTLVQLLGWHANKMILALDRRIGSVVRYRNPSFIGNLHACRDLYNNIYTVDYYTAVDKLNARDFKPAEQRLLMAYKRAQGCEDGFRRIGKNPYNFLKQNKQTCQLALVAAGATHSLYN